MDIDDIVGIETGQLSHGDVGHQARALLENFDVVATVHQIALVPASSVYDSLRANVRAAVVAATLDLKSIDYAKQRYCQPASGDRLSAEQLDPADAYISAYQCSKAYIERMLSKLDTRGRPDPAPGVFGASLVLERLPSSFFAAHLLYRLGHRYEGHAVARLILEQIAWAFAAREFDDVDRVEAVQATKAVTGLKQVSPGVGRLYGFLSVKTHIDYSSHRDFLFVHDGQNAIRHAEPRFLEFAEIMLRLADLLGLVWEWTQIEYIPTPEAVLRSGAEITTNPDRPFLTEMTACLTEVKRRIESCSVGAGKAS